MTTYSNSYGPFYTALTTGMVISSENMKPTSEARTQVFAGL